MRQHRELGRQALVRKGFRNVRFPARRTDQTFLETVGLAELETNARGRLPENDGARVRAPQCKQAFVVRRQRVTTRLGGQCRDDASQRSDVPVATLIDHALAIA